MQLIYLRVIRDPTIPVRDSFDFLTDLQKGDLERKLCQVTVHLNTLADETSMHRQHDYNV